MSRRFFDSPHPLGSPVDERPPPVAGRSIRLSILGWAQAGFLATLVCALVVLTSEPTPHKEASPAWVVATEHPQWVRALAFAPDGRRLATTGGDDGAVVVWAVGQGVERELADEPVRAVHCLAFSPD